LTQLDFQFAVSSSGSCKGTWIWQQPATLLSFPHPVLNVRYARWFVSAVSAQPLSISHYTGSLVALESSYSIVFFPDDTSVNATVQKYELHDPDAPITSIAFSEHLQVFFSWFGCLI
jgi:hypothetical protein